DRGGRGGHSGGHRPVDLRSDRVSRCGPGRPGVITRPSAPPTIGIALLGAGTVGSAVARILREQADELAARVGARLELVGIAVRRPHRHGDIPDRLLTTDSEALVADPRTDIVVEMIGGIEPARTLLLAAL